MSTTTAIPDAAQRLADDAREAGFTQVKVEADEWSVTVTIAGHPEKRSSGAAVWEMTGVGGSRGRLGFVVYGDAAGEYHAPKSVRRLRGHLGLEVD